MMHLERYPSHSLPVGFTHEPTITMPINSASASATSHSQSCLLTKVTLFSWHREYSSPPGRVAMSLRRSRQNGRPIISTRHCLLEKARSRRFSDFRWKMLLATTPVESQASQAIEPDRVHPFLAVSALAFVLHSQKIKDHHDFVALQIREECALIVL